MIELTFHDRIEGIDANEISASKECDICHYYYSQMTSINLSDIAIAIRF